MHASRDRVLPEELALQHLAVEMATATLPEWMKIKVFLLLWFTAQRFLALLLDGKQELQISHQVANSMWKGYERQDQPHTNFSPALFPTAWFQWPLQKKRTMEG